MKVTFRFLMLASLLLSGLVSGVARADFEFGEGSARVSGQEALNLMSNLRGTVTSTDGTLTKTRDLGEGAKIVCSVADSKVVRTKLLSAECTIQNDVRPHLCGCSVSSLDADVRGGPGLEVECMDLKAGSIVVSGFISDVQSKWLATNSSQLTAATSLIECTKALKLKTGSSGRQVREHAAEFAAPR